jgi:hypothetical protein
VFINGKRRVVLFAFAAAVTATAACSADATAPPVPVTRLKLKQPLNLDTAEMCPYGWIVMNGVIVCDDS